MSGIRKTISLCLAFAFFVFSFAGISAADTLASISDERLSEEDTGDFEDSQEPMTFISGPFYDGVINDEYDALEAIKSVLPSLGGDDNTELIPIVVRTNEEGTVYYTFQQFTVLTAGYSLSRIHSIHIWRNPVKWK